MVKVTLVYPYFQPSKDNSIFRFPPLGLGYVAAALKKHNVPVELVDCTFLTKQQALQRIEQSRPRIVGVYSMFSMKKTSLEMAQQLRGKCELLVVGGPLPTLDPTDFLEVFDVAVVGEGEETMVELVECVEKGQPLSDVKGIAYKKSWRSQIDSRQRLIQIWIRMPFPAENSSTTKPTSSITRSTSATQRRL